MQFVLHRKHTASQLQRQTG